MKKLLIASRLPVGGVASLALACGALAPLMLPGTAIAQEWRLEPEVRIGGEYDDNARLRTSGSLEDEKIDGYILEGSAGIAYLTQRTTFRITPTVRSRVYDEEIDVDSDDQFLDVNWNHQTLKGEFGIRAAYGRESARTAERADAEIDEDDPDDIPTDDTGILFGNQRRERIQIQPQWSYELTERTSLAAGLGYTDTSYDDAVASPFVDYSDSRVTAALSREFSPRNRGYVAATARRYENDADITIDGVGLGVGLESHLSQTTRLQAEIGVESSERDDAPDSETNMVADINLVRQLETITLLAQYRRNLSAGGAGRVVARDSLNFNMKKQFTQRVSGGVGVRAYQTESIDDDVVAAREREYTEFHALLNVALSRAFSAEADYRYARLDESLTDGSADSNSIILWLIYRPTPIVSSR